MVADASALLDYLLGTETAGLVGEVLRTPDIDLHVPALCDVEIVAGLRRGLLRHAFSEQRAGEAIQDYSDLSITRHGHRRTLLRVLDLRANFSAYDAVYVALAEELEGELLTTDTPLARATRTHTRITVI